MKAMKALEPMLVLAFGIVGLAGGALLAAALGRAVCAILFVNLATASDAQAAVAMSVFLVGAGGCAGAIVAGLEFLNRRGSP